ncbi:MAG: SIMPL domain-containing protein [Microthrixaceae bacterium]|nr:SIMPL domain-containing protein [Microthrixaceae bacterium]HPB44836.1 SIMPL domain-containing protein [Microthrixaceae bacterium]
MIDSNQFDGPASGIQVIGRGRASSAPDVVTLTLGVSVREADAPTAIAAAATAARALLDALGGHGVDERDISTDTYSIQQEWSHVDERSILDGYRVRNIVTCLVRDAGAVGSVLDAATSAAGGAVEVQGLAFAKEDLTDDRDAARQAAVEDARHRGEHLAALTGRRIGAVEWVRELDVVRRPGEPMVRMAMADSGPATPLMGGEHSTEVVVEVRYSFGD